MGGAMCKGQGVAQRDRAQRTCGSRKRGTCRTAKSEREVKALAAVSSWPSRM